MIGIDARRPVAGVIRLFALRQFAAEPHLEHQPVQQQLPAREGHHPVPGGVPPRSGQPAGTLGSRPGRRVRLAAGGCGRCAVLSGARVALPGPRRRRGGPAAARVRARSDLDGRGPAGRGGRRRLLFGDPPSARSGAGCACFPGRLRREESVFCDQPEVFAPSSPKPPSTVRAAWQLDLGRLVSEVTALAPASVAALRREPLAGIGPGLSRKLLAAHGPAGPVDSDRWAAVLRYAGVFAKVRSKRRLQRRAAHVAGQLHGTRISSRTKCNRINFGRGMVSSK